MAAFAGPPLADGVALRLAILAVPPAFRRCVRQLGHRHRNRRLSGAPIVIFAAAALAGSRLVARIGVIAALTAGLLLTALGSAARSLAFDTLSLFATTVVMGMGVAVAQPAMPAWSAAGYRRRLVLGTGVYTNGLLVGEICRWRCRCCGRRSPIIGALRLRYGRRPSWSLPGSPSSGAARPEPRRRPSLGPVVARLAGLACLAAGPDLRRRRAALFRHQCVLARLFERGGQGRPHQPGFDRAQSRAVAGIFSADRVLAPGSKAGPGLSSSPSAIGLAGLGAIMLTAAR